MPLRILFAHPPASTRGGLARSTTRVAVALGRAGHHVTTCSPDPELFPGDVRDDADGRRFGPCDLDDFADHLVALAARRRPDVVLGYYATSAGFCAVSAARLLGLPSVVSLRGNDLDRDFFREDRHALLDFAVRRATAVCAVSREACRKVRAWFGVRAAFVTNGVDTAVFRPDPDGALSLRARWGLGDRPVLGVFGVLKPKRGLCRLRALDGSLGGWQVVVAGEVRPEVAGDLPEGAVVLPWIEPPEDLRAAYSAVDVVAQPSVHDGMPNVVLEAMACGRAVVASPAGGLPDVVRSGENGVLCETEAEWAAALACLDRTERDRLGAAARRTVPTVDEERAAIEEVLFGALRGRR